MTITEIIRGIGRLRQSFDEFHLARTFARWSASLAVTDNHGHPIYERNDALRFGPRAEPTRAELNEALFTQVVTIAALPGAPDATDLGFETDAHGALRLLWRNKAGAAPADVSFRVWVQTGPLLGWAILSSHAAVLANTELRIPSTGYRRVYLQVTATNGGDETIDVWLAGEA